MLVDLYQGLEGVRRSLEKGDVAVAMIKAAWLRFPEIEADNLAKLEACALEKFNLWHDFLGRFTDAMYAVFGSANAGDAGKKPWQKHADARLREYLGSQEVSSDTGYGVKTVDKDSHTGRPLAGPNHTALGRYQFRNTTLVDAGWKNRDGSWTDKAKAAGVTSDQDFLANPDAQEQALTDVLKRNSEQLKANGADQFIGQTIKDSKGHDLKITSDGLAAAAHREGAGAVRKYLDPQDRNLLDKKTINAIELRLRLKRR